MNRDGTISYYVLVRTVGRQAKTLSEMVRNYESPPIYCEISAEH